MDTANNIGNHGNVLEIDFDLGPRFALAKLVHLYIAEKKLPVNSVLTIRMKAPIDEEHYDVGDGEAFGDLYSAMDIKLEL
jgi:hypothetical protein